ncbi:MAG: guanylate kinase [Vampirovibrionia bacterium]
MVRVGNVIVLTGPSGVGKGTIVKQILKKHDDVVLSVSATTRKPRPGETDGVEYYFKSVEEFKSLIEENQMLEWAVFADNYYGTYKAAVEKLVKEGKDVILEIEVQGAMQVKDKLPEAHLVFISPPSLEELKTRLVGRATEPQEVVAKRLKIAEEELSLKDSFTYQVINDDVETAVKDLEAVIMMIREKNT